MLISDDVKAEDAFVERFRQWIPVLKKWTVQSVYEKQHVEKFSAIDLLEITCNKVKLDE